MTHCYPSTDELVENLSIDFLDYISQGNKSGRVINIALSGGNSPKAFFERIALNQYKAKTTVEWPKVHLFWVDERCVPPDHADSNYGMALSALLQKIDLKESSIHRIRGENNPGTEARRYGEEVKMLVPLKEDIPVFDLIFLGVGDDGHTASIFPNRMDLLDADKIYETAAHPDTGQIRITMTGKPILRAKKIIFLVTGLSKSTIVRQIMNREPESSRYPAAYFYLNRHDADWYLDSAAAKFLKSPKKW
ncbi:MAG: 6-phosphogluconolactonase [Bacteroidales bacterium]|nr:6-phosphogluconolactonase [Bacteroidales bacterium]